VNVTLDVDPFGRCDRGQSDSHHYIP
jgi:hypothetical protein